MQSTFSTHIWRRKLTLLAVLLLTFTAVGTLVAPTAARAAIAPPTSFYVSYGNSFTKGTVNWYNLSVQVIGTHKAASNCRYTQAWAWNLQVTRGAHTSNVCAPNSANFKIVIDESGAGG